MTGGGFKLERTQGNDGDGVFSALSQGGGSHKSPQGQKRIKLVRDGQ